MEFQSCFDIIGPIMVGPSSSHTAGAVSIGKFVHELLDGTPDNAHITFYQSFAETYQGHGTDKALIGGILGLETDDTRIKHALDMAEKENFKYEFELKGDCPHYDHPNIAMVCARRGDTTVTVGGASLGGGLSKVFLIDDQQVDIRLSTGDNFTVLAEKNKHYMKGKGE